MTAYHHENRRALVVAAAAAREVRDEHPAASEWGVLTAAAARALVRAEQAVRQALADRATGAGAQRVAVWLREAANQADTCSVLLAGALCESGYDAGGEG